MMAIKAKKQPAVIDDAAKERHEKNKARTNLSSAINAAAVIEAYSKSVFGEGQGELIYVYEELNDSIGKVWNGDMKNARRCCSRRRWRCNPFLLSRR